MNSILLRLTKLHIKSINGRFVQTQTMKSPDGVEQEVAIFSGDKTIFLGQCTPFRTIIIHESVLNNERLSNYVLIHEMAHKKQWWSYFAIPLSFLLIFSFFYLAGAFVFLILLLISMNLSYLSGFMWCVIVFLLAFIIPCAFSWGLEMNADFAAIKDIGLKAFEEIRGDSRKTRKLTLSSRIIIWLTHPPVGLTVRVWRWRHKQEKV
jgi:Zn-dependent protease with chaperone function